MRKALPLLLAIAITCSACLDEAPARSAASGTPNTTASPFSPPPTPAALTKAQAAKRYLRIVRPYNTALERFETAAHANQSWLLLRAQARRIATANAVQIRALRATWWPPEARKRVAALVAVSVRAGRYWSAAAKATSPEQFRTAVLAAARLSGKREATALRKALGLPPYRG